MSALYFFALVPFPFSVAAQGNDNAQNASENQVSQESGCTRNNTNNAWIDQLQVNTHTSLCKTVRWIDGLFGNSEKFDSDGFSGRIIFGAREDEEDGFDPRLRVRIKSKLPNVSKRFNAFIGRLDEDSFITENNSANDNAVSHNTITRETNNDANWLLGLGYSQNQDRGFDASIGAKISSGLNPYALARYRYLVSTTIPHYLNLTQTLFWRRDERYGFSSSLDYSYTLGEKDILGWGLGAKYTTENNFWETQSAATWYHKFAKNRGIATRFFIRDSEEYSASWPEYGINLVYRRPFLRNWSFIEFGLEKRWEKKQHNDPRASYVRFGAQIEIRFGRHYEGDYKKRKR